MYLCKRHGKARCFFKLFLLKAERKVQNWLIRGPDPSTEGRFPMCPIQMLFISMILATDTFVLSLGQGLRMEGLVWGRAFRFSGILGMSQGGMLFSGWALGQVAGLWLSGWYPWLVFVLLLLIGGNRIRCGLRRTRCTTRYCQVSLVPLALILSLDAFSVGLGFSLLPHAMVGLAFLAVLVGMVMALGGILLGLFMGDFPWMRNCSECAGGVFILVLAFRALPLSAYPFF